MSIFTLLCFCLMGMAIGGAIGVAAARAHAFHKAVRAADEEETRHRLRSGMLRTGMLVHHTGGVTMKQATGNMQSSSWVGGGGDSRDRLRPEAAEAFVEGSIDDPKVWEAVAAKVQWQEDMAKARKFLQNLKRQPRKRLCRDARLAIYQEES